MSEHRRYQTFQEFWPMYVREHSLRATRRLHFVGTLAALTTLVVALATDWRLLLVVPVAGYGFAWYSHFFVERNRPATFIYPVWSLRGDFRMFWLMLRGKMDAEVQQHAGSSPSAGGRQA